MDIDKMVTELESWTKYVTDSEEALAFNKAGRDKCIRKAIDGGVRISAIVKATGLTRGRIYQIKDAPERDDS